MSSSGLYGYSGNVTVSSNNLTTLYNATTGNVVVASTGERNFTTLYTQQTDIKPTQPYGNANVEAFLNVGFDSGGNQVQNIIMTGSLTVGGQSNLGPVGNVHITGGALNQVLSTDGGGGLSWANVKTAGSIIPYISFNAPISGIGQQFTNVDLALYSSNVNFVNLMKNGVNILPTDFVFVNPTTIQVNILLEAGDSVDVLATGTGVNVGGNVTEVQYNGGGSTLEGNSSFTFTQATSTLTVGNLSTGNLSTGNITNTSNISTGNIITSNANVINLNVSGVSNLGLVGNVKITGGSSNQVLSTDGFGDLSWVNQSGGVYIQEEGSNVVETTIINFVGPAVSVSNVANVATVTITDTGIPYVTVQDEGSNIVDATIFNFVGSGVAVSNVGNIATVTITSGGGGSVDWANIGNINGANGPNYISIGQGSTGTPGNDSVAIGTNSGAGYGGVSIGYLAGNLNPAGSAVAIGPSAGRDNQGSSSIAIGSGAGVVSQMPEAVAIGSGAGQIDQRQGAIAIGFQAGLNTLGSNSIAIGTGAGTSTIYAQTQGNNSIILNATGANLVNQTANTFTVKPVRNSGTANLMFYDNTTGEITYNLASSTTVGNASNANSASYAGQLYDTNGQAFIGGDGSLYIAGPSSQAIITGAANVTIGTNYVFPTGYTNKWDFTTTGNLVFPDTTVQNTAYTTTPANLTVTNNLTATGNVTVQRAFEVFTPNATGSTGTVNLDVITQSILFKTASATANITLNIRGNSTVTLDTLLPTNDSLTVAYLNTVGATAYVITAVTIDGTSVTPKYVNGSGPTVGTRLTSATQSYTYSILKTAANTYTVLGSLTEYQ